MKGWVPKFYVLLLAVAILTPAGFIASRKGAVGTASPRGFSIIPLHPDVAKEMKAKGKAFQYPFPNSANKGKKFNPEGEAIGQLETAATQKVLVLFADFTTPPPGGPAARRNLTDFDSMLFGTVYSPAEYIPYASLGYPTDRTLKNYYSQVSYGQVDVVTLDMPSLLGWTQSGHPYDFYCQADGLHDNGFGPFPNNVPGLVIDVVTAADGIVDFSQYAVDGEVPNLFVVYAGTGAEWSGDPSLIWSHSWSLTYGATGPVLVDGVKIDQYAAMPEVGGDLTGYTGVVRGPYPPTVGVFAHEYGHVLGLPDQYDYGYESNGTDIFSLMAYGSWNTFPRYAIFSGNSPAHLDAWSKYRLGFAEPVEITGLTDVTLRPAETEPDVYKMAVPNSGGKEYYLLENRQQIGFDQGLAYGTAVHGLAIYHIDETVLSRIYWRPNEAENWKEFRSEGWKKAWTGERHYAISLIQADDQWHLERGAWAANTGDLYPGPFGVTRFGSETFPNSSSYYFWGGSEPKFGYSGVTVENIAEAGGNISATASFVPWMPAKK